MRVSKLFLLALSIELIGCSAFSSETRLTVYSGYVTQLHCKGRLYLSSVGNEKLLTLQPVPKEMGCSLVLSPNAEDGQTDLLIKTSTGDFHLIVTLAKAPKHITSDQLEVNLANLGQKGGLK